MRAAKIFDANNTKLRIRPWRESLSDNQIQMLNKILKNELEYYDITNIPNPKISVVMAVYNGEPYV